MMTRILGIDPGKNGAFFLLHFEKGNNHFVADPMPIIKQKPILTRKLDDDGKRIKKQRKTLPDWDGIAALFRLKYMNVDHVFIERVSGGQSFGRAQAGSFNFGETYGFVCGMVMMAGLPLTKVPAAKWKPHFELGDKTDKSASRTLAKKLLPSDTISYDRVKDDGVAEAGLIGLYGFQTL